MRKRIASIFLLVLFLMSLSVFAIAEETEKNGAEPDGMTKTQSQTEGGQDGEYEWNVLLYLCGTDLESGDGAATDNLAAIARTVPNDRVNFLVETGGARKWDPKKKLGFEIAGDRLQRWQYGKDGFVLAAEAMPA